jgi:hypothetical protein
MIRQPHVRVRSVGAGYPRSHRDLLLAEGARANKHKNPTDIRTCHELITRPSSRQTSHGTTPGTAKNTLKVEAILWLICGNCDREAKADLPAIIQRGLGDRAVTDPKFKCTNRAT